MTPTQITTIREASDLVAIAAEYFPLTKKGGEFWARCPFHTEKSASFHIHPSWQVYKCFGCDAKGDAFSFIQRIESMPFPKAAEYLAERAGITVDRNAPLTMDEKLAAARRRQEVEAIAADCAEFVRQWIERLVVMRNELWDMSRSFSRFAAAQLGTGELSGRHSEWADMMPSLEMRAERLDAAVEWIREADPDTIMKIYQRHRAAHPLTAAVMAARLESRQHAERVAAAVVEMLAESQELSATA